MIWQKEEIAISQGGQGGQELSALRGMVNSDRGSRVGMEMFQEELEKEEVEKEEEVEED